MPFLPGRLKALRDAKNWSQEDVSRESGLAQSAIAKYEQGKTSPRSNALDKLAQALNCTTDYLLGRGPDYKTHAFAAASMALDSLISLGALADKQREMCSSVVQHPDAPRTAKAWRSFLEMMEMAKPAGSPSSMLTLVEGRTKKKAMGTGQRRDH